MAELKSTVVAGGLSAKKIYQDGVALDNKFGSTLGFTNGKLQLKDAGGTVISEATIPAGAYSATTSNSITAPKVAVSGSATGFTASSTATSYYVTVTGTPTNGSVTSTSTAKIDTSGWLAAGSKTSGTDTDTITPTVSGSGGKVYIPAAAFSNVTTTTSTTNSIPLVSTAGYTPTIRMSAITVPASTTFNSVTLTAGSSSSRTYINKVTVNGYTTIKDLTMSGIIDSLSNNNGIITLMTSTDTTNGNRITNITGKTTITNHGTTEKAGTMSIAKNGANSSYKSTINITDNTYGTVNINGTTAGDKMVRVVGKTATVDGVTVTNSSGDLITATLDDDGTKGYCKTAGYITAGTTFYTYTWNETEKTLDLSLSLT